MEKRVSDILTGTEFMEFKHTLKDHISDKETVSGFDALMKETVAYKIRQSVVYYENQIKERLRYNEEDKKNIDFLNKIGKKLHDAIHKKGEKK